MKHLWHLLHYYSLNCNVPDLMRLLELILREVSCSSCTDHVTEWRRNNPCHSPFDWCFHLHNAVNIRLGRRRMNLNQARREVESLRLQFSNYHTFLLRIALESVDECLFLHNLLVELCHLDQSERLRLSDHYDRIELFAQLYIGYRIFPREKITDYYQILHNYGCGLG